MPSFIKKIFSYKETRFLFVGVLNTAFGYGIFALFIFLGIQYFIANTLSYILGIIHSYLWNKFFTFRTKTVSASEPLKFVSVYFVSYLFSNLFLWLFVEQFHASPYVAGAASLFLTTAVSYFGHSFFSFTGSEQKAVTEEVLPDTNTVSKS